MDTITTSKGCAGVKADLAGHGSTPVPQTTALRNNNRISSQVALKIAPRRITVSTHFRVLRKMRRA
jgi:hypothetical protein